MESNHQQVTECRVCYRALSTSEILDIQRTNAALTDENYHRVYGHSREQHDGKLTCHACVERLCEHLADKFHQLAAFIRQQKNLFAHNHENIEPLSRSVVSAESPPPKRLGGLKQRKLPAKHR